MSERQGIDSKPRPRISPDSQPFWAGCAEGRLLLPTCADCGKPHLPAGPVCPYCLSERLDWREASGRGTITTWVEVHKVWFPAFAADVPYNAIQVRLDEGPNLTARLVPDTPGRKPAVGERVTVAFERVDDEVALPVFHPET